MLTRNIGLYYRSDAHKVVADVLRYITIHLYFGLGEYLDQIDAEAVVIYERRIPQSGAYFDGRRNLKTRCPKMTNFDENGQNGF